MSIGNNIKNLRKEMGLTQKQLADIAGVTDKAVSMWEMDRREPRMGAIQKIADHLGVAKSKIIDEPSLADMAYEQSPITIPILSRVSGDSVIPAQDILSYDTLSEKIFPPGNYFWLVIQDDSMAPTITKGDKLLVRLQDSVESGDYGVVCTGENDGTVRRVVFEKEHIVLASDNPYYPKQVFEGKGTEKIKVIGRIMQLNRKF